MTARKPRIVPSSDTPLPFSVARLAEVKPYMQQPFMEGQEPREMVAWALLVGSEVVHWEILASDLSKPDLARTLMRGWLGVRL